MNKYPKTSYHYLVFSVFVMIFILIFSIVVGAYGLIAVLIPYGILVNRCVKITKKDRAEVTAIMEKGTHHKGTFSKLLKVEKEFSFGAFNVFNTYILEAEVIIKGKPYTYRSDIMHMFIHNYIPEMLDVYVYGDKCFIDFNYRPSKLKRGYIIKSTTYSNYNNRKALMFMNELGAVFIAVTIFLFGRNL